jgi:hypothetical protein
LDPQDRLLLLAIAERQAATGGATIGGAVAPGRLGRRLSFARAGVVAPRAIRAAGSAFVRCRRLSVIELGGRRGLLLARRRRWSGRLRAAPPASLALETVALALLGGTLAARIRVGPSVATHAALGSVMTLPGLAPAARREPALEQVRGRA